jgi:hypothetical protein
VQWSGRDTWVGVAGRAKDRGGGRHRGQRGRGQGVDALLTFLSSSIDIDLTTRTHAIYNYKSSSCTISQIFSV